MVSSGVTLSSRGQTHFRSQQRVRQLRNFCSTNLADFFGSKFCAIFSPFEEKYRAHYRSHVHIHTRRADLRGATHTRCFLPNEAKICPELRSSKFSTFFFWIFTEFLTLFLPFFRARLAPGCCDQQPSTGTHTHTHSNARSRRGHFRAKGNSRRTSTSGISRSAATRNFLLLAPKPRFLARFSRHFRSQWALRDDDDELFFLSSFTGKFRINRFHHFPRHETEPVFVSKINNGNSHGVPKFLAPADGEREQRDVVVPSDSCVV